MGVVQSSNGGANRQTVTQKYRPASRRRFIQGTTMTNTLRAIVIVLMGSLAVYSASVATASANTVRFSSGGGAGSGK